jgi:hypothetical protein
MRPRDEKKELVHQFSDSSRKVLKAGNEYLVPQKLDLDGNPLTPETFDARKHLKRLKLDDLRFLKTWREVGWNTGKAVEKLGISADRAKRLVKRLQVFRQEDEQVQALAKIPTLDWITAKHVENVYEGGNLEESERDSLKELAKISGAYKTASTVNIQTNVFNLPKLSPEAMSKLKEFADHEADIVETDIAA